MCHAPTRLFDREENTRVHDCRPLGCDFPYQHITNLELVRQAMLLFVSLNHHEHLLQNTPACNDHLKSLLFHVGTELLHANDTLIVCLPVPYYKHAGRIVGELVSTQW